MDNSTTTWIMVALLLLLIGAAIFMLLRRPGGDGGTAVDNRDVTGVDAPGAAGNTGTAVLAEGRDLGPGSAAPEMDSLRGRADEPFDQHAADEREHDSVVADETQVSDESRVTDEDQGLWRDAAAVGAAGAAGAGAVAATRDEEPVSAQTETQETEYVVREDDHEPVPFADGHDDVEPVEDTYSAPAESTYAAPVEDTAYVEPVEETAYVEPVEETAYVEPVEETAYVEPVEETAYVEPVEEPAHVEPAEGTTWDDTFVAEPSDGEQVRADEVGGGQADVHPLSPDEIDAGARQEPLPADEQTPPAPEDVSGAEASAHRDEVREDDDSDTDRQGWQEAAAIGAAGAAGAGTADVGTAAAVDRDEEQVSPSHEEYEVGEPTTYGTDRGDAVAVEEQPQGEGRGYHDDTTLVRGDDPGGTAAPETSTTDYEEATTAGGRTPQGGRAGATVADDHRGDRLDQPLTDGGTEDRGPGSTYAEPGTDATLEDTMGRTGLGETASTSDTGDGVGEDTHGGAAAAGAAGGAVFAESAYGPGSAEPGEDGTGPTGWAIKGNSGSMLFHTPESPSYDAVRAEVWFESEETARAAGFAHWDRRRR